MPEAKTDLFNMANAGVEAPTVGETRSDSSAGGAAGRSDSFDGAASTPLATHDPNWANVGTWNGSPYAVADLMLDGTGNCIPVHTYNDGGARYTGSNSDTSVMTVAARSHATSSHMGPCVRANGTSIGYFARLSSNGTNWNGVEIYKGDGTQIAVNSSIAGILCNVSREVRISASGTSTVTITVYIDGVLVLTGTDSASPITSGNPGFLSEWESTAAEQAVAQWRDYP